MPREKGEARPPRGDFSCYVYGLDRRPLAWCHDALAAAILAYNWDDGATVEWRGRVLWDQRVNDAMDPDEARMLILEARRKK